MENQNPNNANQQPATGYMTVYTCDICSTATFPTMEEALAHEETCRGPPSSSTHNPPQAPMDESMSTDQNLSVDKTLYKCGNCLLLFADAAAASSHEKSCRVPKWTLEIILS